MKELVRYLLDNMFLDFQGEVTAETVRNYLREDDSREARQLLNKIIQDGGIEDLLSTMADVLKDQLRTGIREEDVRDQLGSYSES